MANYRVSTSKEKETKYTQTKYKSKEIYNILIIIVNNDDNIESAISDAQYFILYR
jgi:hypothetical protein